MLVIHNPVAGRRRAGLMWQVISQLVEQGLKVEVAETEHAGHATQLAQQAAQTGIELVIAAGGDGTIAEIAQGLLGSETKLGVIPLGTANVLAKEYGLATTARAIAKALVQQNTRALWPGVVHLPNRAHVFVQMLGVGFDGAVVHAVQPGLKRIIGKGAYVWQSLCQAVTYQFPPIALRVDGTLHHAVSVIVSKGRFYGGAHVLAPLAAPDQPGFQVVLFEKAGAWPALLAGAALPFGAVSHCPGVRLVKAHHIEFIASEGPFLAQTDGDALRSTPLSVMDAAQPLSLIVS